MPRVVASEALAALTASRAFAPDYGGSLTNHLPMCIVAMTALGATDERLDEFFARYSPRLEPPRADATVDEWAVRLQSMGVAGGLRFAIDKLAPGLAGAAFHGVIRVAYAAMTEEPVELAHAVAYFGQTSLALAEDAGGAERDLRKLARRLRAACIERALGATITQRLATIARDDRFQEVIRDLAVDDSTLSQCSKLGALAYLAADDFASLHTLTASHALRSLRCVTTDHAVADRALAVGALACYVSSGSPALDTPVLPANAPWDELRRLAVASDDDHVAKLTLSCMDEFAATGDDIYWTIATRICLRGKS